MTNPPRSNDDEAQQETDRQADLMKAQLRKDVDAWSKARNERTTEQGAEAAASVVRKPSPPPKAAAASKPAAKPVAKTSTGPKKPFSMSYDGVTSAEYIQYMIDRGSR